MFELPLPHVAVVSADGALRSTLLKSLRAGGLPSWGIDTVPGFMRRASRLPADMLVVHVDFNDPTTSESLRLLRGESARGIVALTPVGSSEARTQALNYGADHWLPTAAAPQEIYSTLNALWRRINAQRRMLPAPVERLAVGGWSLDLADRTLRHAAGEAVLLSEQEAGLLAALMRAPGRVVSKPELLAILYPEEASPDLHRVEVILSRARRKSKAAGIALPVRSVFGKGLSFLSRATEAF